MALRPEGEEWVGEVAEGYDVFGIPHGGYLAALGAQAILQGSSAPDLFSITTHYVRKANFGPIRFQVRPGGASRRFGSWTATARQGEKVVLEVMGLVGDRTGIQGPTWTSNPAWDAEGLDLDVMASQREERGFAPPEVARRFGLEIHGADLGFARGETLAEARFRGRMRGDGGVLGALVGCDITPPAVWNAVGFTGWVPTVELTAHVRARPAPGPFRLDVQTRYLGEGFLEEDALVWDARGQLVVQSRQLARFSEIKS